MEDITRRTLLETLAGAVGSAAVLSAFPPSEAGAARVRVSEAAASVEMENGRIKARFTKTADGIEQEFFAKKRGGWVSMVRSLRPAGSRPGAAPLYAEQDAANEYRLLASNAFTSVQVAGRSDQRVEVTLRGELGANKIEQSVVLTPAADYFHVETRANLGGPMPRLEYLLTTFTFAGGASPDFTHVPCLKRAADNVIGDRIFDAPAAILQKSSRLVALVPDLDLLNKEVVYAKGARPVDGQRGFTVHQDPEKVSFPSILDLDLKSGLTPDPVFSFGYCDFITEQHVFWRHENKKGAMVRELSRNTLHYGFDLFVSAEAPDITGYQRIARHEWERYGTRYFAQPRPQAMPFAEYAKVCYPEAFKYKGDVQKDTKRYSERQAYDATDSGPLETWQEFELDGKRVGGIRATPTQWYYDIQFSPWWNNVRDAVGMYWWGKQGDATLVEKARRMVNLALAAPQDQGIFPSVYNVKEKKWVGCYWKLGEDFPSRGWPFPTKWEPTKINTKFWNFQSDFYQPSAASKTGAYLLRYRRECEDDARIVPYVRKYGDFLASRRDPNGCVPAWFTADLQPVKHLRFNGEGGVHIWFLSELHGATRDRKYLDTAERMAAFMMNEILPRQRWYDYETFYSCSIKPEDFFDSITGQWPQCTLSMLWAIDGFASLYEQTGKREYLKAAEAVADYAGLFQAVWQPHFIITAYAFGGFRSQNSDAEWLDMRQSLFGEAFTRVGLLTGRQEMLERGVAAVRSSFAVINHPRHVENAIFRHARYPLGIEPENIDHEGLPQDPLRSGFDWGEGGALSSAAGLLRTLGGAFVDFKKNMAVGVDGIHVKSFNQVGKEIRVDFDNQLASLPYPFAESYPLQLRIEGMPAGKYQLVVNGQPARALQLPAPDGISITVAGRAL